MSVGHVGCQQCLGRKTPQFGGANDVAPCRGGMIPTKYVIGPTNQLSRRSHLGRAHLVHHGQTTRVVARLVFRDDDPRPRIASGGVDNIISAFRRARAAVAAVGNDIYIATARRRGSKRDYFSHISIHRYAHVRGPEFAFGIIRGNTSSHNSYRPRALYYS